MMKQMRAMTVPQRMTLTLFLQLTSLFVLVTLVSAGDLVFRGLRRYPYPVQTPVWSVPGGDAERGRVVIEAYGCGACHVIPDIRSATGRVGPELSNLRRRIYLAGIIPNTPEALIAWIRHPQEIDPQTAMPDLGVTEAAARDIAAYLYGQR